MLSPGLRVSLCCIETGLALSNVSYGPVDGGDNVSPVNISNHVAQLIMSVLINSHVLRIAGGLLSLLVSGLIYRKLSHSPPFPAYNYNAKNAKAQWNRNSLSQWGCSGSLSTILKQANRKKIKGKNLQVRTRFM